MSTEEYEEPVMTRREALQGGSAAAVAVGAGLLSNQLVGAASAQTSEPRIELGSDYTIHDDGSNLKISHGTNGDILEYNASQDKITTLKPAESVTTDEFFTTPAGVILSLNSQQTIADDTITTIEWQNSRELNSASDTFEDVANNAITIPNSEYNVVRATVMLRLDTRVGFNLFDIQVNGNHLDPITQVVLGPDSRAYTIKTPWLDAVSGDSYRVRFRQRSGSSVDTSLNGTWFMLEAL